jgi:hypothetical protein
MSAAVLGSSEARPARLGRQRLDVEDALLAYERRE